MFKVALSCHDNVVTAEMLHQYKITGIAITLREGLSLMDLNEFFQEMLVMGQGPFRGVWRNFDLCSSTNQRP